MTRGQFPIRATVLGYNGYQNTGDELLLSALVRGVTGMGLRLSVLSRDPEATRRVHGVDSPDHPPFGGTQRPSLRTRWRRSRALLESDLLILSPGGFFQDYDENGVRNMFAILRAVLTARLGGARVISIGLGAGPLVRPWGRRITRWIAALCDFICVRDAESMALLQSIGIPTSKLRETADLAFTLPPKPGRANSPNPQVLGISIFDFYAYIEGNNAKSAAFREALANALDHAISRGARIRFISMQGAFGGHDEDEARRVAGLMKHPAATEIVPFRENPLDTWDAIAECDRFIGMRYHSVIMALLAGVPFAGIAYHPKVTSLMHRLEMTQSSIGIHAVDSTSLSNLVDALMNSMAIPPAALAARHELASQAQTNLTALAEYCATQFGIEPYATAGHGQHD